MLRKYDLKEASWYLENPVKKTIWTAIGVLLRKRHSHWSAPIIQLLPLYKGLNFLTAENLKTQWNDSPPVQNQLPLTRRCSETANKIKAAYRHIHSTEQTNQNV